MEQETRLNRTPDFTLHQFGFFLFWQTSQHMSVYVHLLAAIFRVTRSTHRGSSLPPGGGADAKRLSRIKIWRGGGL
ncbi:hypothetical protein Pfo_005401 [Paulownia fortunei]|nr:hypothetical protein Pfo_005401 [Paulownia fortunei]